MSAGSVLSHSILKEQVDDITFLVTLLIFNMMLISKFLSCLIICYFVEINTCIFLMASFMVRRSNGFPRSILDTVVGEFCGTADLFCKVTEHGLCQLHHSLIVSVCLIKLHQGEFRIVTVSTPSLRNTRPIS